MITLSILIVIALFLLLGLAISFYVTIKYEPICVFLMLSFTIVLGVTISKIIEISKQLDGLGGL